MAFFKENLISNLNNWFWSPVLQAVIPLFFFLNQIPAADLKGGIWRAILTDPGKQREMKEVF